MNLLFKLGMMAAMLLAAIAGNSQSKSYKSMNRMATKMVLAISPSRNR